MGDTDRPVQTIERERERAQPLPLPSSKAKKPLQSTVVAQCLEEMGCTGDRGVEGYVKD